MSSRVKPFRVIPAQRHESVQNGSGRHTTFRPCKQQVKGLIPLPGSTNEEGILHRSPAARVPLPKTVVKPGLEREQPAWTEDEIGRFIAVADDHRWAAGFRLCVLYGLRRSELLALRWDDLDLDAGTVRVDEGLIEVKGKPVWTDGSRPGLGGRSRSIRRCVGTSGPAGWPSSRNERGPSSGPGSTSCSRRSTVHLCCAVAGAARGRFRGAKADEPRAAAHRGDPSGSARATTSASSERSPTSLATAPRC